MFSHSHSFVIGKIFIARYRVNNCHISNMKSSFNDKSAWTLLRHSQHVELISKFIDFYSLLTSKQKFFLGGALDYLV